MTTITRMNDNEYTQAFVELENATEINETVLAKLTLVGNERLVRMLESQMGHRSQRGNSSSQNQRFVNLMNNLNERFNCKISRYKDTSAYETHSAGWSRWAK
jgi:hypothetical protein